MKPAQAGKIYLVDRQNAAQTTVQQVTPLPGRNADDYYAIGLADAVYGGGGFGTRLNLNLREDKGYSYGVFSFPVFHKTAGSWTASGGVQTDKTAPAIVEFARELKNLGGMKPISDSEFVLAKERQMRGRSQEYETLGQIAGRIVELWSDGLPMSEMDHEAAAYEQTTLTETNAAAKRYASPEKSIILLIGDRGRIESSVRALNIGEVVILDSEGHEIEKVGQR